MNAEFISPAFEEWKFENPEEGCYRWRVDSVSKGVNKKDSLIKQIVSNSII